MTPIDEFELRRELAATEPPAGASGTQLSSAAIRRGRTVQRRRTAVAVMATLLVVGSGIGIATMVLPGRGTTPAEPLPQPSVTAPVETPTTPPDTTAPETTVPVETDTPTGAPTEPRWNAVDRLPGEFGSTGDAAPLHWQTPAEGDNAAWESSDEYVFVCGETPIEVSTLAAATGGKTTSAVGPESVNSESVLTFATEDEAADFLAQLRQLVSQCAEQPPHVQEPMDEYSPTVRTHVAVADEAKWGEDAFVWSTWTEAALSEGEDFQSFPGGSIGVWARNGNLVAMASHGGEYLGNPTENSEYLAELDPALEHLLK